MIQKNIFNPYYNKANGISIGFILSVLLCSKIKEVEREIIYLFYIANIIPHEYLKVNKEQINYEFLLKLIFKLSKNKKLVKLKDLRDITSLSAKETFDKHFNDFFIANKLENRRIFTFSETYKILKFWQGQDKIGRIEAYTKNELASRFFNGNYENLEIQFTNYLNNGTYDIKKFNRDYYSKNTYIRPAITIKFLHQILEESSLVALEEDVFKKDYYLLFFFGLLFSTLLNYNEKELKKSRYFIKPQTNK